MLRLNKQILYLPGNPKLWKRTGLTWKFVIYCPFKKVNVWATVRNMGWGRRSLSCSEKDRRGPLIFEMHWTLWKDKLWFKSIWLCSLKIISAWLLLCHKCFLVERLCVLLIQWMFESLMYVFLSLHIHTQSYIPVPFQLEFICTASSADIIVYKNRPGEF